MTPRSLCAAALTPWAWPLLAAGQAAAPRPFAVDSVVAPNIEVNASFSPDGRTLYFSKADSGWRHITIYEAHREGAGWTLPSVASFSGTWKDAHPGLSRNGHQLFFISNRPTHAGDSAIAGYNIWMIERQASDAWSAPRPLDAINRPGYNMYPSVARDGTLYFTYASAVKRPATRLYRARFVNGHYTVPEAVPFSGDGDFDATVAPDERFVVFASSGRGGAGRSDLFISYRRGDRWTTPVNLGQPINSPGDEIGTGLSRDLATLYFSSDRDGVTRIYQVTLPDVSTRSR